MCPELFIYNVIKFYNIKTKLIITAEVVTTILQNALYFFRVSYNFYVT